MRKLWVVSDHNWSSIEFDGESFLAIFCNNKESAERKVAQLKERDVAFGCCNSGTYYINLIEIKKSSKR